MGEPLNILEPFIAVANSEILILIIPIVFLTLIADYPKLTPIPCFISFVSAGRTGCGADLEACFYDNIISCGNISRHSFANAFKGFWYNGWSNVATGFVKMFPDRRGDFGVELLPENLYNQLSVFEAAVKSYLLVAAYLMIIGLILLVFSLFKRKTVGFIICGGMISLGMAFSAIRTNLMWTMPMANSITWLHYTKYFKKPIMPMSFSVIYLLVLIAVLAGFRRD